MKNNILAVVLSAFVLFFWGFFSWTILPWHNATANQFLDESSVAQTLKQNAPQAVIYYLPFAEEDYKVGETSAFVNVLPNGFNVSMGQMMGTAMLGQLIAAFLVLLLLKQTSNLTYFQRVRFVFLTGIAIGFISSFPYWNWFGFSTAYTVVAILDSMIAWTLAGLVLAKFIIGKQPNEH